jgi:hypothetical protein
VLCEEHIEQSFIGKLQGLKYDYRPDITDRATLERNVREKFESINRVRTCYFANNNARQFAMATLAQAA